MHWKNRPANRRPRITTNLSTVEIQAIYKSIQQRRGMLANVFQGTVPDQGGSTVVLCTCQTKMDVFVFVCMCLFGEHRESIMFTSLSGHPR